MAHANGSGPPPPEQDAERTQRLPTTQGVVETWFSDDDPASTTAIARVRASLPDGLE